MLLFTVLKSLLFDTVLTSFASMLYFNIFSQNLIPGLKRMGGEIAMITREKVFKETEQREIDLFHVKVCFLYCLVIHCHQLLVQMMNRVYFYFFIGN